MIYLISFVVIFLIEYQANNKNLHKTCAFEARLTMALRSTGSKPVEDWTFSGFFGQFLQSQLSCADQFIISYQLQEKILEIYFIYLRMQTLYSIRALFVLYFAQLIIIRS